jgi:hypothetical protein
MGSSILLHQAAVLRVAMIRNTSLVQPTGGSVSLNSENTKVQHFFDSVSAADHCVSCSDGDVWSRVTIALSRWCELAQQPQLAVDYLFTP